MNRQEKLIAEIHAEFDTAQDRLLVEAKKVLCNANEAVVSVSDRLKAIGFVNTPTAKKGSDVKQQLVKSSDEARLIEYYSREYPFLKFLTESELDRICKKYNLIYCPSDRYTEEVPEKNLKDIETAQSIKYGDSAKTYFEAKYTFYDWAGSARTRYVIPSDTKHWQNPVKVGSDHLWDVNDTLKNMYNPSKEVSVEACTFTRIKRDGLFIAAPMNHFNLKGLTQKGLGFFESLITVQVKDPIVFRYVRGGIQVLTKWGLEANDPDLVVPKLN